MTSLYQLYTHTPSLSELRTVYLLWRLEVIQHRLVNCCSGLFTWSWFAGLSQKFVLLLDRRQFENDYFLFHWTNECCENFQGSLFWLVFPHFIICDSQTKKHSSTQTKMSVFIVLSLLPSHQYPSLYLSIKVFCQPRSSYPEILHRSSQLMSVLRGLCFPSETMPFLPDDVTSTFGPLVGAWARTGIVFQRASGCPVGGWGEDRRRGDATAQESSTLWMVVVSWSWFTGAPRAPWMLDPLRSP